MADTFNQRSFSLTETDDKIIAQKQEASGDPSKSAALRMIIREWFALSAGAKAASIQQDQLRKDIHPE